MLKIFISCPPPPPASFENSFLCSGPHILFWNGLFCLVAQILNSRAWETEVYGNLTEFHSSQGCRMRHSSQKNWAQGSLWIHGEFWLIYSGYPLSVRCITGKDSLPLCTLPLHIVVFFFFLVMQGFFSSWSPTCLLLTLIFLYMISFSVCLLLV